MREQHFSLLDAGRGLTLLEQEERRRSGADEPLVTPFSTASLRTFTEDANEEDIHYVDDMRSIIAFAAHGRDVEDIIDRVLKKNLIDTIKQTDFESVEAPYLTIA